MGKSFKIDPKHIQEHTPDEQELIERDWKHHKISQINGPSNKQIRGHFNKQHIWPVTNENHSGHRKI